MGISKIKLLHHNLSVIGLILVFLLICVRMLPADDITITQAANVAKQTGKRHCLSEAPKEPRFTIPADRVWPLKTGEGEVCLWAGDKLAAASITIDDNWAPDHDWWMELGRKTGFRFTWFVITERVGSDFGGKWEDFRKLRNLGHDIQSHSVSHLRGQLDIESEYRDSQAAIEKAMSGKKVLCLAYPGGEAPVKNDPDVAVKYYIGARGTVGAANTANAINYMMTNSATINKEWVDKILDKEQLKRGKYGSYRAWLCSHYHGVNYGKTDEEKKTSAAKVAENIMYLKSREADIWVGLFREVVLYGQERDTAKLKITANSDNEIRFFLSDDMDDAIFDYPLTVKLRLTDAWNTAEATQGGKPVEIKLVTHENAKFALVRAIPDRGEVEIVQTAGVLK
jgi:hypothetical protein